MWTRLDEQLTYYRCESRRAKRAYFRVKVVQIVVGATIPVLAASGVAGWITACVAAIPVMAEGVQQLFQWHGNWLRARSTAEALKNEKFLYLAEAGPYAAATRRAIFAERVTALVAKETGDWAASAGSDMERQVEPPDRSV